MNDIILIENLTIKTIIGVYHWERKIKQPLIISAKISCDITNASKSDDVADTIDYKKVCQEIEEICHQTQAKLIESLAEKICHHILQTYPCSMIELTIKKPLAITNTENVGIHIIRQKLG